MSDSPSKDSPRPTRLRPFLLFLLLLALLGLLMQHPDLRRDALQSARSALLSSLDISPRELYGLRLRVAGLEDSTIGRRWRDAVDRASEHATHVAGRYVTHATFAADAIEADVYTTSLKRGEQLEIHLTRSDDNDSQLFADLERRADGGGWHVVAPLPADGVVWHERINHGGQYRIVLQPELAASIDYRLALARGGSLAMPVEGARTRDIGSGFGAPRDGGKRAHHGVDIFADRGTPVHAVAAGRVRTGTQGIGGNHVWLSSGMLGIGGARYYYAHLDSFAVESGDKVAAGEVLGRVGNTGNARTTPPHLHFGIYTNSGAIDPAPFLEPAPQLPATD